jgi:YidC/Oxa1 family membrane protein insertase
VTLGLLFVLEPLEHLLRHILNGLHSIGLPWAWSIVGLTVIVRMLLVPLTVRQIHSMQNMQRHAPQMKEIQKKYKNDRQKMNEELMKFYRENNINPASSCLPLVAQIPIFIGLFYTLRHFASHPPSGDLSWLHFLPDITKHANAHWSGWILITIYVLSQLSSTYFMSGTIQQAAQRYVMYALPILFIPFIIRFPAGLVLYWMTTNLWTVGQGLITRRLIPKTPLPTAPKRSSRASPQDGAKAAAEPKAAPANPAQPRRVKRKKKARR